MSSDFGGMIEGTSVDFSDNAPESLKLRSTARGSVVPRNPTKGGNNDAHHSQPQPKKKTPMMLLDDDKINANVAASIRMKYAFGGSSASMYDGLATFAVNTAADKEHNDRLVYRVGKQVCVLDPDSGAQQFFSGRSKTVNNILHFVVSPNHRHISMCESIQQDHRDDHGGGIAQVSVYSLNQMTKLKTLSFPCGADFICSTFCSDPKMIAALSGEADRQIVIWQWDKDKVVRTCQVHVPATRLRSAPGSILMLTTTGVGMLRCWFVGTDGQLKSGPLLPPQKETDAFLDHCWLPPMMGGLTYKMVALTDPDLLHHGTSLAGGGDSMSVVSLGGASSVSQGSGPAQTTRDAHTSAHPAPTQPTFKRQQLLVFEGVDVPGASAQSISAPIAMELKQTINLRVESVPMHRTASYLDQQTTKDAQTLSANASAHGGLMAGFGGLMEGSMGSMKSVTDGERQHPKSETLPRIEAIVPSSKGFILVGGLGLLAIYERIDDKKEPFIETKRIALGSSKLSFMVFFPSDERAAVVTKSNRLLLMQLDLNTTSITNTTNTTNTANGQTTHNRVQHVTDANPSLNHVGRRNSLSMAAGLIPLSEVEPALTEVALAVDLPLAGGHHLLPILAMDIAFERPLLATVSADRTCRVWNYETLKCEIIHNFRTDDLFSVAIHPTGFSLLVGFKDRVGKFNILMDRLKPHRETTLKKCSELKFSNGGQYWAGATGVPLYVFDTVTCTQLMVFQGHMMPIRRICWAPGDQVVFTAGRSWQSSGLLFFVVFVDITIAFI